MTHYLVICTHDAGQPLIGGKTPPGGKLKKFDTLEEALEYAESVKDDYYEVKVKKMSRNQDNTQFNEETIRCYRHGKLIQDLPDPE